MDQLTRSFVLIAVLKRVRKICVTELNWRITIDADAAIVMSRLVPWNLSLIRLRTHDSRGEATKAGERQLNVTWRRCALCECVLFLCSQAAQRTALRLKPLFMVEG